MKVYHLHKPIVTATLTSGGSLEPNTTYYVRVISYYRLKGMAHYGPWDDRFAALRSDPSDEISFTTDTTNLSARIRWSATKLLDGVTYCGYKIFVTKVSGKYRYANAGNTAVFNYSSHGVENGILYYDLTSSPAYRADRDIAIHWVYDQYYGALGFGLKDPAGSPVVVIDSGSETWESIQTAMQQAVGYEVFDGSGLDDMTTGGTFIGSGEMEYIVEIDATGTPDTFKWSDDGGATWTTGVAITGSAQTLSNGVEVTFGATTGHTIGDRWYFISGLHNYIKVYDPFVVFNGSICSSGSEVASFTQKQKTIIWYQGTFENNSSWSGNPNFTVTLGDYNSAESNGYNGCEIIPYYSARWTSQFNTGNLIYGGARVNRINYYVGNPDSEIYSAQNINGATFNNFLAQIWSGINPVDVVFNNITTLGNAGNTFTRIRLYNGRYYMNQGNITTAKFVDCYVYQDPSTTSYSNCDCQISDYSTPPDYGDFNQNFYDFHNLREGNRPSFYFYTPNGALPRVKIFTSINLTIVDEQGNPIEDATIKVYNKNDALDLTVTSDVNGQANGYITPYYFEKTSASSGVDTNVGVWTDYSPFTIQISKKGYKTYTWEGNISEKIDWEITLKPYTSDAPEGIATTINDDSISASISEDSISATVSEDAIASSVSEDKITATISEDNISVEVKD